MVRKYSTKKAMKRLKDLESFMAKIIWFWLSQMSIVRIRVAIVLRMCDGGSRLPSP